MKEFTERQEELIKQSGVIGEDVLKRAFAYSATTTIDSPFVPEQANKCHIKGVDGSWYLDFTAGVGVANLGYNVTEIYQAIERQFKTGLTQFLFHDWASDAPTQLCKKLVDLAPGNFDKKVFLCSSGTEANEAALKLAFAKRPERKRVIAFEGAFHGRTGFTIPLMGSKPIHSKGYPLAYPVHFFPFPAINTKWEKNCIAAIERQFKKFIPPEEVNLMIIELIQGEGGINLAAYPAIKELANICKTYDILLCVDEIQTGMGRTGKIFASDYWDIEPDIITLAKALGSGVMPIGATIFRSDLDWSENGRHSTTNGGNILAAVAALKTIKLLNKDKILAHVRENGEKLFDLLDKLKLTYSFDILDVRGNIGLMVGIEFRSKDFRDKVVKKCFENKLIVIGAGESVLRITPPLIITLEEIKEGVAIIETAIKIAINERKNE